MRRREFLTGVLALAITGCGGRVVQPIEEKGTKKMAGEFYRLWFNSVAGNWAIDQGRGRPQQTFDAVIIQANAAGDATGVLIFEKAVLSIDGTVATLTQGSM